MAAWRFHDPLVFESFVCRHSNTNAYIVPTPSGKYYLKIFRDDKKIELQSDPYDDISVLELRSKKHIYARARDRNTYYLLQDDCAYTRSYRHIFYVELVNDIPLFSVENRNSSQAVIYGKKKLSEDYEHIVDVLDIGGKPGYIGQKENEEKVFLWYNNKFYDNGYYEIADIITLTNGDIAFCAQDREENWILVHEDLIIGAWSYVGNVFEHKGKLAATASDGNSWVAIYAGKVIKTGFDSAADATNFIFKQ